MYYKYQYFLLYSIYCKSLDVLFFQVYRFYYKSRYSVYISIYIYSKIYIFFKKIKTCSNLERREYIR